MPNRCGSTPAAALALTRASGSSPCSATASAEASSTAAAPSDSGDELPAVTVPSGRKTGFNAASDSVDASGRMPSSVARSLPSGWTTWSS